jgi:SIR2-like domain
MTGARDTFDAIERLVTRVIAGEAVFFAGAGFSLDSEPNSSARLIRRLLTRFAAITEQLANVPESVAPQLREGLRITFKLGHQPLSSETMISDTTVDQLTQVYYNINDWICSAFTILLRELKDVEVSVLKRIRAREKQLLATKVDDKPYDDIPLGCFDNRELLKFEAQSGKALFLETMGFADDRIWRGDPRMKDPRKALDTYGGRLRDRHFVIARLAREGVAPLILTTNFDLLLEGACRAVGFEPEDAANTDPAKPSAAYDRLLVIAGPADFFERGTAFRAAMLVKIHGCVHRYREERKTNERWARYLPSMVFTYREIQNWRKDSWSRDLVSTLLRTRSIVLCGYSGADPVVHDTFRTVYEEILAQRPSKPNDGVAEQAAPSNDTRAFFTGAAGKGEFAGLEILRAGSRAAGVVDPKLFDHPNYLGFHLDAKPGMKQSFPTLDELFLWIYHRSLRSLQLNAIRSDLCRIAVMLLHRNVAPADIDEIAATLKEQCRREIEAARKWNDSEVSRRQFQEVTAWTNHFHVALLREFALIETVVRNQRSSLRIQDFRSSTYYFALLDRPGWGAWGAVVEMALRKMSARAAGVVPASYPVAVVTPRRTDFTRTAVVLRGAETARGVRAAAPGLYRRVHEWQLMSWLKPDSAVPGTPLAEDVWRWSFLPAAEPEKEPPGVWFGESDERKAESGSGADGSPGVHTLRAAVEAAR